MNEETEIAPPTRRAILTNDGAPAVVDAAEPGSVEPDPTRAPDAPTGPTSGTGARRRRRRGGRGRGRGGGGARGTTADGTGGNEHDAESTEGDDAAAQTPPRNDDVTETEHEVGEEGAAGESSATGPRRRRRRGGRGRGKKSTAELDQQSAESDAGADDEAPSEATAETQRDDAAPDGPTTGGTRRRRGGSGRSAKSQTSPRATAVNEGATTKAKTSTATRSRKAPTVEQQVAAGGPTRGLRSTRSRTGREGGRRRREPTVVPPRVTDKLMVITEHGERDQIAVLEENVLVQHYVTRTGARSMVGNVYLGRVQNVLPGMEAAFVDIGRGRNGVLYAGEVNYRPEDLEGPAPRIEQVLKPGQAVVVQVTKDPMGGKGARLTAQISMPGRYLVLAPNQGLSGISRRLSDDERKRLKGILKKLKPSEHGVIVRTAAEGASEEALTADLQRLVREWEAIQKLTKKVKAPDVLYEEPELTVRVVRDLFTDEEFRALVTDSRRVHDKIMSYVRDIAPDLEAKISLHQGKLPAFEEYRIVEQIHKALDKKVWLASGGYLFIERTEAMTIIDVNTGKSVGKTNLEETVVNTNLEAASEVARQLRLRDIGGIIVIDFIDMLLEQNKKKVEDTMKEALAADKTRSQVFEIGPLGLMQVTRKRVSSGLVESFSETCPTCEGRGIIVNYEA
jgi:ribonuclease E